MRIIALQYHVCFCYIWTWIGHRYIYEPPSHLLAHPTPLGYHRAPDLSSRCQIVYSHRLCNFTYCNIRFNAAALHSSHSLLPPLCPQVCSLSASPLLPCKQVHEYHISRFHIYRCVNIRYLSFSFWLTSLCVIVGHSFCCPVNLASQLHWLPPAQLSSWFTLYSTSFFSYRLSNVEFMDYHQST